MVLLLVDYHIIRQNPLKNLKEKSIDRQRSMEQVKSRMTLLLIHLSVADLIVILFQVSLFFSFLYFLPTNQIEGQKILLLLHLHFPQPNQTHELHEINGVVKSIFLFKVKSYSTWFGCQCPIEIPKSITLPGEFVLFLFVFLPSNRIGLQMISIFFMKFSSTKLDRQFREI